MPRNPAERASLVIFAREPEIGRVKTRLARELSEKTTLILYKAFLKDIFNTAANVRGVQRWIYFTGSREKPFLSRFKGSFTLKRQCQGDLGERMYQAFSRIYQQEGGKAVIIGADSPAITPEVIECAFSKLDQYDAVLGPSSDGGYYLIGLKRPRRELFRGIKWGESSVLKATLGKIKKLKKRAYLLKTLDDIDTLEDLKVFARRYQGRNTAANTFAVIRKVMTNLVTGTKLSNLVPVTK